MTHEVDLMSLRAPRRLIAAAAVPALLAGVAVAAPANATPAADEPKYKGSAFALQARLAIGGETLLDVMLPDVVSFPSGGDKTLLSLPPELKDVATLKVLNASADVKDRKLVANSSTAGLSVLGDLVGARVLNSDCSADQLKLAGDSQVAGIELLGTKVPVDPGPNFRIEIPKELEALLSGGITIDEQNKLPGGGLQVRALHINLVIAPDALGAALRSALESVRKVAQQVVTTVETMTGKTLDEILAKTESPKPAGGAQADRSVRSKAVATKTQKVEKAEVTHKAAAKTSAEKTSVAAEQTRSEAVAEQSTAAEQTSVSKADEAQVNRQAAADQAAAEQAMAERAERGAKPTSANSAVAEQEAADAAAAERAEAATTQGSTVEAPEAAEPPAAPEAPAAEKAEDKAAAAEKVRAERTVTKKSDRADLGTPDRTAVRAAAPAPKPAADDDDEIKGLLGVDVIVSEVNCVGARFIKKEEPKRVLPKTGGGDMAQDIAVTGLGLLLAGSAAAFVTRRRRHHR